MTSARPRAWSARVWHLAALARVGIVAGLLCCASGVEAQGEPPPLVFAVELHGSAFSNQQDRSLLNVSFGGGLRVSYRPPDTRVGVFVFFEQNAWLATELFNGVVPGVRNFGVGTELLWGDSIVRSSGAFGLSMLAYDTELDARGTTGVFFDIRPASVRWRRRHFTFEFTPLHMVIVAPVLSSPTLITAQYRTTLTLEYALR